MGEVTRGEHIALRNTLSEFPDKPFKHILLMIINGDDEVTVWSPFADWSPESLVEFICDLVRCIDA